MSEIDSLSNTQLSAGTALDGISEVNGQHCKPTQDAKPLEGKKLLVHKPQEPNTYLIESKTRAEENINFIGVLTKKN